MPSLSHLRSIRSTAIALATGSTVNDVSETKKLDRKYADHLAGVLRVILDERFDGNGTAFAEAVGVSQSQMSSILRKGGGDRSVGINVLIRLREYIGTMSLDEMLGLPKLRLQKEPPSPPPAVQPSEMEALLQQAVERALDRRFPEPEAPVSRDPVAQSRRKKHD